MAALLVVAHWLRLFSIERGDRPAWERLFVVLWVAPGLLVALFRHTGQSGYVLFAVPAIFLYTPTLLRGALERLEKTPKTAGAARQEMIDQKVLLTVLVFVVVGAVSFIFGAQQFIRVQEEEWGIASELPSRYPPSKTIVLSDLSRGNGFRHAGYHMPDYHVYGFDLEPIKGPLIVPTSTLVVGWVFHSYQLEDNYSLEPDETRLNAVLVLPAGTSGLLVNREELVPRMGGEEGGNVGQELPLEAVTERIYYVALPSGMRQLVVVDGQLEVRR
jgi:hypothetical protein